MTRCVCGRYKNVEFKWSDGSSTWMDEAAFAIHLRMWGEPKVPYIIHPIPSPKPRETNA